jgi:RNA polymerase sigma factor (sigma-70 family)
VSEVEVSPLSESTAQSFAELMDAVRTGSEDAAWTIAELYTPHLLRAVRANFPQAIRSKVDSTDIVNTLWASLLLKRQRLEGIRDPAQLIALLTIAARNRVIDEHRKYTASEARDIRREVATYGDDQTLQSTAHQYEGMQRRGSDTPSQVAISREKWRHLLASLSERDRLVVKHRVNGKSFEEIEQTVEGVSERTARRVIAMVIERLSE